MRKNFFCFVLLLTLFAPSFTYAKELTFEKSEFNGIKGILGNGFVEDIITRQLSFQQDESDYIVYTVKEGDNLFRIAYNHSVPLDLLMEWNNLENTLIHPGNQLIIKTDEQFKKQYKPISIVADATQEFLPKTVAQTNSEPSTAEKELTVTATAYTAYCKGCSGTTAYGINLRENPHLKVIAVDPSIIPLGTKVWVEGYGYAIAGDTGGAIKGNKIDVFIPSYDEAMQWGVKKVKIKILD